MKKFLLVQFPTASQALAHLILVWVPKKFIEQKQIKICNLIYLLSPKSNSNSQPTCARYKSDTYVCVWLDRHYIITLYQGWMWWCFYKPMQIYFYIRIRIVTFLSIKFWGWSMGIAFVWRRGNSSKLIVIAYKFTHITKSTFIASTFYEGSKLLWIYLYIIGLSNLYTLPRFRLKSYHLKFEILFYDVNLITIDHLFI